MDTVIINRVDETRWQALDEGRVVGHGDVSRRPDGRLFVSIDAWRDEAFDRLAAALLADLPAPLHTLVGEADTGLKSRWERAGFTAGRREREYVLPTDPRESGLDPSRTPAGVRILPGTQADADLLRALHRAVREEAEAGPGWRTMPAEVLPRPNGPSPLDPSRFTVAVRDGAYVGLVRVAPVPRRARIGLVAVRAGEHRRGIGRALLAHALGSLHHGGTDSAWAEVDESNTAAITLFEGIGARRTGGNVELVRH
ncbi:GNAT family N-acetyltransferase [Streptomyces sp. W1SF4]|uniref:GNAT family N-acetyltransferase n=1 Tax=Streptomyces sp. W1SF4 TaxID=2305220 RepID=UPI000F71767E|nr:GNAT family N-acetyltransferase [Streptomyces sp. W1SF4]AZM87316.1 GNAT family N-acetyltransferase [Streptomyces sp. W1SF4]